MVTQIEFNTVLALREYGVDDNYSRIQCIPTEEAIAVGSQHKFLKLGYRVFELDKLIPLVVTEGNQRFKRVVGLVVIDSLHLDKDPVSGLLEPESVNDVHTTGRYWIVKVFNQEESDIYLGFLNPGG